MTAKRNIHHLVAIILAISLSFSFMTIMAEAKASDYIASYSAYMNADGSGKVSAWFTISGLGTMDEIGAITITIYEVNGGSETAVKTYQWSQNPGMLGTNKGYHSGNVSYSGVAGRQYYASVYLYAGKGGKGDTRRVETTKITAT